MDSERFIDLKDLFQRRIDDPSKRRPIQRVPGVLFSNNVFVFAPDCENRDVLVTWVAGCEDTMVLKKLHKKVTFCVVSAVSPLANGMALEAHNFGVPVITTSCLNRCVKEGSFKVTQADLVDVKDAAAEAAKLKRLREEEEAAKAKKALEEERKQAEADAKAKAEAEKKRMAEEKAKAESKRLEEQKKSAAAATKREREDEEIVVSSKISKKSEPVKKIETTFAPPPPPSGNESESDTPKIEDSIGSLVAEGSGKDGKQEWGTFLVHGEH